MQVEKNGSLKPDDVGFFFAKQTRHVVEEKWDAKMLAHKTFNRSGRRSSSKEAK